MRLTIILLLASFAACRTGPASVPTAPEIPPWLAVDEHCDSDRVSDAETCGRGYFKTESRRCVEHFRAARHFSGDLVACQAERALDGDVAASRLADCDDKLKSPWRSPWLWGAIGLVLGGAIGVGVGAGAGAR